jgi:hypothetical protein
MPTKALGVPMLHGGKEPAPAIVQGEYLRSIRAPQDIGSSCNDLSLVLYGLPLDNPVRREQIMFTHDA